MELGFARPAAYGYLRAVGKVWTRQTQYRRRCRQTSGGNLPDGHVTTVGCSPTFWNYAAAARAEELKFAERLAALYALPMAHTRLQLDDLAVARRVHTNVELGYDKNKSDVVGLRSHPHGSFECMCRSR